MIYACTFKIIGIRSITLILVAFIPCYNIIIYIILKKLLNSIQNVEKKQKYFF